MISSLWRIALQQPAKFFRWSHLRRIGKSRVLRSSYIWLFIVPLVAKGLSGVSGLVFVVPIWGKTIELTAALPFSWKLFFFSAVAFSIGGLVLVYAIWCPPIVRNFANYMAFLQQGRDIGYFERYEGVYAEVDKRLKAFDEYNRLSPEMKSFQSLVKALDPLNQTSPPELEKLEKIEHLAKRMTQELFWKARDLEDRTRKLPFIVCALVYALGFIGLSVVAVQNILFV